MYGDKTRFLRASALLLILFVFGCGDARRAAVPELSWDELIPPDWDPEAIVAQFDATGLDDEDPRAIELWEGLRQAWAAAPTVAALDGRRVRLAGFALPLEPTETPSEFLLVPYFGSCIHEPPPPANQMVHVLLAPDSRWPSEAPDLIWVTGTLRVVRVRTAQGMAGYRLENAQVARYE